MPNAFVPSPIPQFSPRVIRVFPYVGFNDLLAVFASAADNITSNDTFLNGVAFWLKFTAISISGLAIVATLYFILKLRELNLNKPEPVQQQLETATSDDYFNRHWQEIQQHATSDQEIQWRVAVIEADKLVDEILRLRGYEGKTMGERLTLITREQLNSIDYLWYAHKIRNRIVHQTGSNLTQAELKEALEGYQKALRELGVL